MIMAIKCKDCKYLNPKDKTHCLQWGKHNITNPETNYCYIGILKTIMIKTILRKKENKNNELL